jgi:hypothetical protein
MREETRTTRILGELKAQGVRLCIDDFGTGYSSLSYLRRFALDVLKIDRSFVSEMLNNSESREIVKTIISLGSNLGMEVVAEGVETAKQVEELKKRTKNWSFFRLTNVMRRGDTISAGRYLPRSSPSCSKPAFLKQPSSFTGKHFSCNRADELFQNVSPEFSSAS